MKLRSNNTTRMESSFEKDLMEDDDDYLLEAYEKGNLMIIEDFSNDNSQELNCQDVCPENKASGNILCKSGEEQCKDNDVKSEIKTDFRSTPNKQIEPDTTCASPEFGSTINLSKCANVKPTVKEKPTVCSSPVSDDCCIIRIDTGVAKCPKRKSEEKETKNANNNKPIKETPITNNENSNTSSQPIQTVEKNKKIPFNPKKRLLHGKTDSFFTENEKPNPPAQPVQSETIKTPIKMGSSGFKSTKSSQSTVVVAPYQVAISTTKTQGQRFKGKAHPGNSRVTARNDKTESNRQISTPPKFMKTESANYCNPTGLVSATSSNSIMENNHAYLPVYNDIQSTMVAQTKKPEFSFSALTTPIQQVKSPISPGLDFLKTQTKFLKLQCRHIYIAHYVQTQRQKYYSLARLNEMQHQIQSPTAPQNTVINSSIGSGIYLKNPRVTNLNQTCKLPYTLPTFPALDDTYAQVSSFYCKQNLARGPQMALSNVNNPNYTALYPFSTTINQTPTVYKPSINCIKPRVVMGNGSMYPNPLSNPFINRVRPSQTIAPFTAYTTTPRTGFICPTNFKSPAISCINDRPLTGSAIKPIAYQNSVFKATSYRPSVMPANTRIEGPTSGSDVLNSSNTQIQFSSGTKRSYSNVGNSIFTLDQPLERADNKRICYPTSHKIPRQKF